MLPWCIWILAAVFVVFNYVQQVVPDVMASDLSRAYRASESALGNIAAAFSFIGCLKVVHEWFPAAQFSTMAGLTNTAGMIGAASGAPLAWLVNLFGWRATLG